MDRLRRVFRSSARPRRFTFPTHPGGGLKGSVQL